MRWAWDKIGERNPDNLILGEYQKIWDGLRNSGIQPGDEFQDFRPKMVQTRKWKIL